MHIIFPTLFAALLDDLLKLIVPSVFVVFWVLSQIAEAKKKAKAPRPAQPPQPVGQAGAAQGQVAADPLREQVDAFLRRARDQAPAAPEGGGAAGAVMQKPRPMATPNRDSIEILLGNEPVAANRLSPSEPIRETASTRSSPSPPAPPRRQRTPAPPQRAAGQLGKSVSEHVADHVTSAVRQISDEAERLGERVAAVDRQFDTQLQQKFDHEIGTLGDRYASRVQDQQPAAAAVNPAVLIANLLGSPDGMRQAIVLNEVLRRPEERW
ncbi:MAG TPA: hypothetical protein VGM76_04020 [Lacipirellulaceae bacterium]|jgi:hypothetical protein